MQEPPTHDIRAGAQHFATLDDCNAGQSELSLQLNQRLLLGAAPLVLD